MPIYQNGAVLIRYEVTGDGFPLLIIPGGGLSASIDGLTTHAFNPMVEFADSFRCITLDSRNSPNGQSRGPLDIERPWDSFADDQLSLMDHLGIDKFAVLGFCIGGPFIWNLLRRAPERIVSGVLTHPSGHRSDQPDQFYQNNMATWGPRLCEQRADIDIAMVSQFLHNMYRANPDFVFTVTRDFVRNCETPVLVLPDDIQPHPYAVAMETALLAPNAQVSLYPWKENARKVELAVNHVRMFLNASVPAP